MAKLVGLTKTERLYRILKDGRNYSAAFLAKKVGHRFGAYISDLRDMGFHIRTNTDDGINYRYQLTGFGSRRQTGGTEVELYTFKRNTYASGREALVGRHGAPAVDYVG